MLTKGTAKLKATRDIEDKENRQAKHGCNQCVEVQVKEHLAIHEVGLARLAVLEFTRLKLVAGDGEVVHQLVVCLNNGLTVGTRVLLDIQRINLRVIEGTDVDRQTDRHRNYQNCNTNTRQGGKNSVFHKALP